MGKTTSILKSIALAFLVAVVVTLSHGIANADEVTLAGYSNGCFGACTPPNTSAQQSATILGLTYNNSTFNGTTSAGFLAIGNIATPPANVDNLGSFTLNGTPATYTGQSFRLRVTFTAPPGINGNNSSVYNATLLGSVSSLDNGGVFLDFDNTPTTFTFSFINATGQTVTGSFNFNVNDVSVIAGGTIALSGNITAAQQQVGRVPEPASMLLLGTGLLGIAGLSRRRSRKSR